MSRGGASPLAGLGAGVGAVLGTALGLVDAAIALRAVPDMAGPWLERWLTLVVAMSTSAVALALLGTAIGFAVSLVRGRPVSIGARAARLAGGLSAGLLLASFAVATGTGREPLPRRSDDRRPNVILVSIDTLRPDHLSGDGYGRQTSPRLDQLGREGVSFQAAYSHSSWTLPAHASMLTGMDPVAHGVLDDRTRLPAAYATLAERLREQGYWSGAWVGTPSFGFVGAQYGLDQGFDFYAHLDLPARFARGSLASTLHSAYRNRVQGWLGNAQHQVDSILAWLDTGRREPFFIFLHLYDVHSRFEGPAYRAPRPHFDRFCPGELDDYSGCRDGLCASDLLLGVSAGDVPPPDADEAEKLRCLYDGGIAYTDAQLGRLFDALALHELDERTAVFVTSDHGEAFFEHGAPLHVTLHEEITRVPLIARVPGGAAGKRARGIVRHIDLMPTILELCEAPLSPGLQGTSLVPVLREWPAERDSSVLAVDRTGHSTSVREGRHHFIRNPEGRNSVRRTPDELYDLSRDPGEQDNLGARESDRRRAMEASLDRLSSESLALRRSIVGEERPASVELSDDERARLEALGYADERP